MWRQGLKVEIDGSNLKTELPTFRMLLAHRWIILRSTLIGTVVGAIPGTNGAIVAFLAYDQEKRFSKNPERLGKGDIGGVIAPETANNALTGGAMIPLLGLGIPADPAMAIILGGLMIQGITPGPLLLSSKPEIVMGIYILFGISYVLVTAILLVGLRAFVRALLIPPQIMALCILVMCAVGSFAIRNSMFDVGSMIVIGFIGYLLFKARIPVTPVVLGLVLGPTLERELRTALIMSEGDVSVFYSSVPSILFLVLAALVIGGHIFSNIRARAIAAANEQTADEQKA